MFTQNDALIMQLIAHRHNLVIADLKNDKALRGKVEGDGLASSSKVWVSHEMLTQVLGVYKLEEANILTRLGAYQHRHGEITITNLAGWDQTPECAELEKILDDRGITSSANLLLAKIRLQIWSGKK